MGRKQNTHAIHTRTQTDDDDTKVVQELSGESRPPAVTTLDLSGSTVAPMPYAANAEGTVSTRLQDAPGSGDSVHMSSNYSTTVAAGIHFQFKHGACSTKANTSRKLSCGDDIAGAIQNTNLAGLR